MSFEPIVVLQFFDSFCHLETDNPALQQYVSRMYWRFVTMETPINRLVGTYVSYHTGLPQQRPILKLDGRDIILQTDEPCIMALTDLMVKTALNKVGSHLLCHAGALSWRDKGVLLMARSGGGKTTLTQALIHQGFRFFSDETAAILLNDGQIWPFPQALRIRNKRQVTPCSARRIVDIDDIYPNRLSEPTSIDHVFFLTGLESGETPDWMPLIFLLDRWEENFVEKIRQLEDVWQVQLGTLAGFASLRLWSPHPRTVYDRVLALSVEYDVHIMDIIEPSFSTVFAQRPDITQIDRFEGLMALLPFLQTGYRSRIFQTHFQSRPARLLHALAHCTQHANFYRLQTGPVEETANLIRTTVQQNRREI